MPADFEIDETTLSWDHTDQTVELYTTSRKVWLRAIARNPQYLEAQDLRPGYRLVYREDVVTRPDKVIKSRPGGDEALEAFLTDGEKARRLAARDRILKVRMERGLGSGGETEENAPNGG